MKRQFIVVAVLTALIIFMPVGNDVGVNVDLTLKHPVSVPTKASMEQKKANKIMAMKFAKAGYGWDLRQRQCIYKLFTKESRFDNYADNKRSTAFGIGQLLNEQSTDPAIQILNAYRYIKHRYHTPCKAWEHSVSRNWY
jgi:hypothetical protein